VSYALETTYDGVLLASPDPALGRIGPFGITLNGQQVVDEQALFRAVQSSFLGRGGQATEFKFRVNAQFSTLRQAFEFMFTHQSDLSANGDLTITTGPTGDTSTVKLANAAYASVAIVEVKGISIVLEYTFRGGLFAIV